MPLKIDIQTNINDHDLTIEKCTEIITILQKCYKDMRKETYSHFLSTKSLMHSLVFALVMYVFYLLTEDMFFVYLMPVSVALSMLTSIISAEYMTKVTRKQIYKQVQHYKQKRDALLNKQNFEA